MTGDCHVRFCERLGVKFPWSIRLPTVIGHFVVLEKLDVVVVVFIYRFKNLVKVFLFELCRTYRPPADYPEQIAIVDKLTVNPGFLVFEEVYLFFPHFESPGQDYVV